MTHTGLQWGKKSRRHWRCCNISTEELELNFFLTFVFHLSQSRWLDFCLKENGTNQLCCMLICKESHRKGWYIIWLWLPPAAAWVRSWHSVEANLRGTVCRPGCKSVGSQRRPYDKWDLTVRLHHPPPAQPTSPLPRTEPLPGAGAEGNQQWGVCKEVKQWHISS